MGAGLDMIPGDIAFKVTVNKSITLANSFLIHSRISRTWKMALLYYEKRIEILALRLSPCARLFMTCKCLRPRDTQDMALTLSCRKLPSFPHHSISVKHAIDHRCGVRVRGPGLTDTITGTDPLKDG